jgi:sulfate transport system ATP-binding protein
VQHIFSAGNYARIALVRIDTDEHFEAEAPRDRLRELNLKPGDEVAVVFRHVRLFPKGEFFETDVKEDVSPDPDEISGRYAAGNWEV